MQPSGSPERDVEGHHEREADRERDNADVRVPALRHLRDQFLDHDVEHRARRK